jgi:hypothetical protein
MKMMMNNGGEGRSPAKQQKTKKMFKTKNCSYYHNNYYCRLGSRCGFIHDENSKLFQFFKDYQKAFKTGQQSNQSYSAKLHELFFEVSTAKILSQSPSVPKRLPVFIQITKNFGARQIMCSN